ncbi:MAG: hypothetical protein Q9219_005139 [cf. Caloplaca sp. 3 TL-2023]
MDNAKKKFKEDPDRWADSYPVFKPCCVMIPFGWLFRGRVWPTCRKGRRRLRWEREQRSYPSPRDQTKYPQTRVSPCSLRPRGADATNISNLDLSHNPGLEKSLLTRLPLEIRQEIYSYVLVTQQENCLILLPFKLRTVAEGHRITNGDVLAACKNGRMIGGNDERAWPERTSLLQTCRQVYTEAVSLLYSGNTLVFKHPSIFLRFAKAIPPQRLNCIRQIRISIQPWWHGGILSSWVHNTARQEEWQNLWTVVASMGNLLSLDVQIVDEVRSRPWGEEWTICQGVLPPLLQIRGLHFFQLDMKIRHAVGLTPDVRNYVPLSSETNALIQKIYASVKLPRKPVEQTEEDDQSSSYHVHIKELCTR